MDDTSYDINSVIYVTKWCKAKQSDTSGIREYRVGSVIYGKEITYIVLDGDYIKVHGGSNHICNFRLNKEVFLSYEDALKDYYDRVYKKLDSLKYELMDASSILIKLKDELRYHGVLS